MKADKVRSLNDLFISACDNGIVTSTKSMEDVPADIPAFVRDRVLPGMLLRLYSISVDYAYQRFWILVPLAV